MSEKDKFETWATERGFNLSVSHDGTYVYRPAYYAWLGWQASLGMLTGTGPLIDSATNKWQYRDDDGL